MHNPKAEGDDDREVLYHATCPWSIRCRECLLTLHDGETFVCPWDHVRRVRASRQVTDAGTVFTLVECLTAEEEGSDTNDH